MSKAARDARSSKSHGTGRRAGRRSAADNERLVADLLRHSSDGARHLASPLASNPRIVRSAQAEFGGGPQAEYRILRKHLETAVAAAEEICTDRQRQAFLLYRAGEKWGDITRELGLRSRSHVYAAYVRPPLRIATELFLRGVGGEFRAD